MPLPRRKATKLQHQLLKTHAIFTKISARHERMCPHVDKNLSALLDTRGARVVLWTALVQVKSRGNNSTVVLECPLLHQWFEYRNLKYLS